MSLIIIIYPLYIRENIHFSERTDLSINIEGEFESIFIEAKSNKHRFVVGEIYRTPGTNTHNVHRTLSTDYRSIRLGKLWHIFRNWQKFWLYQNEHQQINSWIIWNILFQGIPPNNNKTYRPVPKYWKKWFRLPWKVYTWNYYEGLEGSLWGIGIGLLSSCKGVHNIFVSHLVCTHKTVQRKCWETL